MKPVTLLALPALALAAATPQVEERQFPGLPGLLDLLDPATTLTIGREEDPGAFARIYQAAGSDLVTFRHVCDELRLCFEFPESDDDDNDDPWASIAFALANHPDFPSSSTICPPFVTEEHLDQPVPGHCRNGCGLALGVTPSSGLRRRMEGATMG